MNDHQQLAKEIRELLGVNPSLTANLLASQTGAEFEDVVFVLDEFLCTEGGIEHVGPGQGGGWVDEETRVGLVRSLDLEAEFIGYRWPDGSLNEDEAFDHMNPDHMTRIGATSLVEKNG